MQLFFSPRPGCFEAHVRRRNRNPLFPDARRLPTQDEVNDARKRDEQELNDFYDEFRAMLDEVGKLAPHVDSDVILGYKERIEQFYERCAGLSGDHANDKQGLERLHGLIMARMLEGVDDNDPYAAWQLEQGEEARKMHQKLLEYPLVAHLLRPDSPIIAEELVPSLLSEEEDAIQATMAMLDPDQREQLGADAEALLNQLAGEYRDRPSLRIRLEAMRHPMEF
jgi:hypothetical protein